MYFRGLLNNETDERNTFFDITQMKQKPSKKWKMNGQTYYTLK